MASIRSVEGRSGALQAVAKKKLTFGSAKPKTPFYVAAPGKPSAPMSDSSSARRAAAGLSPTIHNSDMVSRNAGRDAAQATPKTATQSAQTSTAASRAAVAPRKAVTINSTAPSGSSTYKTPTPGSGSTSTPSTSSTSSSDSGTKTATSAPAPKPTTSSGKGATISAVASGGRSRAAMRGNRKSKRDNPRAARSTSIDELKKQAARSLGI